MLSGSVSLLLLFFFFPRPYLTVYSVCDNSGDSLWLGSLGTCSLPKTYHTPALRVWQLKIMVSDKLLCSSSYWSMWNIMLAVWSTVRDRCGGMSLKDLKGGYCLSWNILIPARYSYHSGMTALASFPENLCSCGIIVTVVQGGLKGYSHLSIVDK